MSEHDRHVTPLYLAQRLGDWRDSSGHLYERLGRRLGQLLADGQLAPAVRLPSERGLADMLQVSRTTVIRAYATLREQGLLESRRGAGSLTRLDPALAERFVPWAVANRLSAEQPVIDLTKAIPPPDQRVFIALQEAAAQAGPLLAHHGYHPVGLPALREAIAARYRQRDVATTPEQILVTAGAQQAIDLIARTHVRHREAVIIESPTYAGAMDSLRLAGARLVTLDISTGPWDPAALEDLVGQTGARMAYLVPDYHNPTGLQMPDTQRRELAKICRRLGVTLVVDETLAELAIDPGTPAAPVAGVDSAGTVLSIGSLSKAVWAGLRVGWIRASPRHIAALTATRSVADLGGTPVEQLAATMLLTDLDQLMSARRDSLREQRDTVVAAARHLGWSLATPAGGLSTWVTLPHGSSTLLADIAHRHGVLIVAGPRLSADGVLDRFLRLPYGLPVDVLDPALERLTDAWNEMIANDRNVPVPPAQIV